MSNKYPIPEEFPNILHDYIREVLRNQPKDILDFSVSYFTNKEKGTKETKYVYSPDKGRPVSNTSDASVSALTADKSEFYHKERKTTNEEGFNMIEEKDEINPNNFTDQESSSLNSKENYVKAGEFVDNVLRESMEQMKDEGC